MWSFVPFYVYLCVVHVEPIACDSNKVSSCTPCFMYSAPCLFCPYILRVLQLFYVNTDTFKGVGLQPCFGGGGGGGGGGLIHIHV